MSSTSTFEAIVRAHVWLNLLSDGTHESVESLAQAVGLHPKVIRKAIRAAFLAPHVTKAVLQGTQPVMLMLRDLDEADAMCWTQQHRQLSCR